MPRPLAASARALLALTCIAGLSLAGATSARGDDGATDSGIVQIPYGEPVDVRASEGWSVDCASVGALEGVEIACAPDGLTLAAPFDADAGERLLPVTLRAGAASVEVRYRVRLAPPPGPEVATPIVDAPLPVGAQSLVPLGMLGITCGLCTDARVQIADVEPASARVGVGGAHLVVRPAESGEIRVRVRVVDDAGQVGDAAVRLFAVDAASRGPVALHVRAAAPPRADALAFGDDVRVECVSASMPLACDANGAVTLVGAPDRAGQAVVRAIDASGRQALGSITLDPDARSATPVAPAWHDSAPLDLAVPPPPESANDGPAPLAPFARILQEVPAP